MDIPKCEIHKIDKTLMPDMPEANDNFYCEICYMVFQAKSLLKSHNYKLLEKDEIAVKKSKIETVIELIEINQHHLDEQLSDAGRGLIRNVLKMLTELKK